MIHLQSIPIPGDSFCVREIDEEVIFLAESGDEIHSTDEVGAFVWKAIDGKRSFEDILDLVCKEYEVERDIAQADLERFVDEMAEKGIVKLESTAL